MAAIDGLRISKLTLLILSLYDLMSAPFGILLSLGLAGLAGITPSSYLDQAYPLLFLLSSIRILYFVSVIYLFKNKTWALYTCSVIVAADLVLQSYIFSQAPRLSYDIFLLSVLLLRFVLAPLSIAYLWNKRKLFS
ncbi:MAG: hypothetical protein A3F33_02210 [Candidatus Woykebacteria bacterium RIFCSPHIGHO2_12_FULL_43_10]|nr:MAG: hypothetical protein A3F33_02210 [Candidatus Woykebacteria bacterium RIFCSPHIGHO2_12_FULL_43_10]